jgi:ATP-binding cassette subfamily B (MDR/TAP) protein 1
MAFISKRLSTRAHEQADKLQQALKYLTNAITSIETVKYFNGERFELHRYVAAISRAGSLYKRQASLRSAQIGFMQFVTLGIFVQGFWYGSYLVTAEKKNPGQIVTTFWGALMAVQGITGFLPQFIVMQKGKVAGAQLQALILQISEHDQALTSSGGRKPEKCSGDIEFNKVRYQRIRAGMY